MSSAAMRAGRLRHRVTIQGQSAPTKGPTGQSISGWSTFATPRWAALEALQGNERFVADQIQGTVTHQAELRHLAGVKPKMRLLHSDGRVFDIQAALDPDGRKRRLVLLLEEDV